MSGTLAFAIALAATLVPATRVVRTADLVHAALWLGVMLLSTAGLYAMLGATFLAAIQVLLYVGGILTLMLFGIMITRRHDGTAARAESVGRGRAALAAGSLFAVLVAAIRSTEGLDGPAAASLDGAGSAGGLGRALVGEHVLAFEVASLLLLATLVGAIVIARRRDPDPSRPPAPRPMPAEAPP